MRIADVFISILLILGSSLSAAGQTGGQQATEAFPTEKGTYWIYRGAATNLDTDRDGKDHQNDTKLYLKMEVLDRVQQGHYKVAKLLGHPSELAVHEKGQTQKRRCHLLISVDEKEFYLDECSTAEESRAPFVLTDREIGEKIGQENLIFKLPLKKDDRFGGEKDYPEYKWSVVEVSPLQKKAIRGMPSATQSKEYWVQLSESHSSESATYVPGIGLITYGFMNGGTDPHSMHLELVEFKSPSQK
jgi:hypothetical protein